MQCVGCGSEAVAERPERTAQGYRRFRCRDCGRQFNERSAGVLNRTQYPVPTWEERRQREEEDEAAKAAARTARVPSGDFTEPERLVLLETLVNAGRCHCPC